MRRFTVTEARERFGQLLDELALRPIRDREDGSFFIEDAGKPVALVLDFDSLEQLFQQQDEWLRTAIAEADADPGDDIVLETDEDVARFIAAIGEQGRARLEAAQPSPETELERS